MQPARTYERRVPERTVLHRVVREHLETFLAEVAARDPEARGIPAFVERELRAFVGCGDLARGFARFRCDRCKTDRLVAFSCKGRGFCPSCGGRRMTALAARLADEVIPHVPVRQWVLSFPFALRPRLAYDHDLCRAALRIFRRAVSGFYRRRARGSPNGRTGSVTVIQRFGGALNLNPHFHHLALDGVFVENSDGTLTFHAQPPPTADDIDDLLLHVYLRIRRLLIERGILTDDGDLTDPTDDPTTLEHLQGASIRQLALTGPRAGRPIRRLGSGLAIPAHLADLGRRRARIEGFDLHADTAVRAHSRQRLERLCAYLLRPPVPDSRLERVGDTIRLTLKTTWNDGTTHLELTPRELLERLAALVPRPHKNTLVYGGVLAANSAFRKRAIAYKRPRPASPTRTPKPTPPRRNPTWAELMRRGLDIDALDCPRCHHRMRFVAAIQTPRAITRILQHLGLRSTPIKPAPARGPPDLDCDHPDAA